MWRLFFKIILVLTIWLLIIGAIIVAYYLHDIPQIKQITQELKTPIITILDKNGVLLARIGQNKTSPVTYDKFPTHLIDAVTTVEDRRFQSHMGIDPIGMARAMVTNYSKGRIAQGGSTITQQLAKNMFLTSERTLKRKIQELFIALYLEQKFSKEQIITMYLNNIYMGSGNYGVDAASRAYFDKPVDKINLYEAAMLAGLIKAPSKLSPIANPKLSKERTKQVLQLMVDNNKIDSKKAEKNYKLMDKKINFSNEKINNYFTDWIMQQFSDFIEEPEEDIIIKTSFDSKIQTLASDALAFSLNKVGASSKISQGAVIIMDNKGAILAMVGGKDYEVSQYNRAVDAMRQPGSAFKLFVYLAALQMGHEPDEIVVDEPIKIGKYQPKNFDNNYRGSITIKEAVVDSVNSVAVRLASEVGMDKVINIARRLGVTAKINNDLSSALGSSEISLLELTSSYAHLANDGKIVLPHAIEQIKNKSGKILYARKGNSDNKILSSDVVAKMNDMLIDTVKFGTAKNAILSHDVAGKTGTTQNYRDAWFIGYDANYVAGVWVGNDDNTPMKNVSGGKIPAKIWGDIMSEIPQKNDRALLTSKVLHSNKSIWNEILNGFGN